jgi:hypothetical protein
VWVEVAGVEGVAPLKGGVDCRAWMGRAKAGDSRKPGQGPLRLIKGPRRPSNSRPPWLNIKFISLCRMNDWFSSASPA